MGRSVERQERRYKALRRRRLRRMLTPMASRQNWQRSGWKPGKGSLEAGLPDPLLLSLGV
jgi:hypothetical protein